MKNKIDPNICLPPANKPDRMCTLPELWSRYRNEIAEFRKFQEPDVRIIDYTRTLNTISETLSKVPACELSAFDIYIAITSVRTYVVGGKIRQYADSIYSKRLAIIRDIYKYLEARGICPNPLWFPPWKLIGDGRLSPWMTQDELLQKLKDEAETLASKRILPRYLPDDVERRLMQRIANNILKDGRWAGLLLLLYQGPRVSEARGLHYRDLVPLQSRPNRRRINLHSSATKDGTQKMSMKNRQSVRAVPEHIEVMTLLKIREAAIRGALNSDDIGDLPIICYGNDYSRPCTSTEFAIFIRKQLDSVFKSDPDTKRALLIDLYLHPDPESADGKQIDPADYELSGRLFRRNYATQCYGKTDMTDDQIAITLGHKTVEDIDYRYSENNILCMMDKLDHRMILPHLHPGWHVTLQPQGRIDSANCGTMFFTIDPVLLSQGATIEIISQTIIPGDAVILETNRKLPPGVEIRMETIYIPTQNTPCRPNTDTIHQPLPPWPKKATK